MDTELFRYKINLKQTLSRMKLRLLFTAALLYTSVSVWGQQLKGLDVNISEQNSAILSVDLYTDDAVITVDSYGQLLRYQPNRRNNFQQRDDFDRSSNDNIRYRYGKYPIEYYSDNDIWGRNNMVKNIGRIGFEYFHKNDIWNRDLFFKQIGNINFEYFDNDIWGRKGKLKKVGNVTLDYFSDWDNNKRMVGQLKSIQGENDLIQINVIPQYYYRNDGRR
ncbi:hypothetical protein DSC47_07680 [Elizabethkingia miricola]|nr:hypothetical protein CQS02_06910 [Elizabethkingia miricola]RBI91195.1 hypothetical protein DSC47_07680 [Elizabethkingia miricola]